MNTHRCTGPEQSFWAPKSPLHLETKSVPHLEIRTTLHSSVPYAPHLHQYLSLGLLLQGQTCLSCAGESVVARQQDLVTLEPKLVHSCNPIDGQPRSYHMLYLHPQWVAQQLGIEPGRADDLRVRCRLLRDPNLAEMLREAVARAVATVSADVLHRLETVICRILDVSCTVAHDAPAQPEALPFVEPARLFDGDSPPQVAELASMAGLSREGFIRAFRRTTGLTPGKYGHCLRIEEGRRLLRLGCSIADTALATGYADQSHFHRMFVRYCAATPRQYAHERSLLFKKEELS